jgi:hypothetical protein
MTLSSFKSYGNFRELTHFFPFLAGWMSLLMFDQGKKVKKAAEENILIKLFVMALLTLAYVHDLKVALWVYLSYFIIRVIFWEFMGHIQTD